MYLIKVRHPDHNVCPNVNCWKSWVGERNQFLSLLFLTRFCTFSLNVDLVLPYTEVASDFQSETLTVFTVTSTNSMNKLVTHWTLVSAWWLLLINHSKLFCCLSSLLFLLKCHWFDFHLHLFYPVSWPLPSIILIVVIFFHNHDMTFASWHIFTCHNALWFFKNSLNVKVHVLAVSLMPECVVVILKQP